MSCVIDFYFFFESYSSWKIKILLTDKKKKTIIEDTKGYRNEVYKLKKKIFEYKYPDLEITEIRREDM